MDRAERINRIIAEQLGVDDDRVTDEATLAEDLGADDLDVVELVLRLEQEFGLGISDEHAAKMVTVEDCHALIRDLTSANA